MQKYLTNNNRSEMKTKALFFTEKANFKERNFQKQNVRVCVCVYAKLNYKIFFLHLNSGTNLFTNIKISNLRE